MRDTSRPVWIGPELTARIANGDEAALLRGLLEPVAHQCSVGRGCGASVSDSVAPAQISANTARVASSDASGRFSRAMIKATLSRWFASIAASISASSAPRSRALAIHSSKVMPVLHEMVMVMSARARVDAGLPNRGLCVGGGLRIHVASFLTSCFARNPEISFFKGAR